MRRGLTVQVQFRTATVMFIVMAIFIVCMGQGRGHAETPEPQSLEGEAPRGLQREEGDVAPAPRLGAFTDVVYKGSYALIIAASKYPPSWGALPGVREDLSRVSEVFLEQGFELVTVEDPTGEELREAISAFVSTYGSEPDNRLVIYYAGHGHSIAPTYGSENMGYLVPIDAPRPNVDRSGFLRTALDMKSIEKWASYDIQSRHVLFIFDSCFAGTIFSSFREGQEESFRVDRESSRPVRYFITSGSADEKVPDRSVFPEYLSAALRGDADYNRDGFVNTSELGNYLYTRVLQDPRSRNQQTPQHGRIRYPVDLTKGDMLFRVGSSDCVGECSTPTPEGPSHRIERMSREYDELSRFEERSQSPAECAQLFRDFVRRYATVGPSEGEERALIQSAKKRLAYWQEVERTGGVEWIPLTQGPDSERAPLRLAKSEITVSQYTRCVHAGACGVPAQPLDGSYCNWGREGREDHPVNCITLDQARAYAAWVGGRLPTAQEWAMAWGQRTYPWGEAEVSCERAVHAPYGISSQGTVGCGEGHSAPVCSRELGQTPEGLCDLAGNVWEWLEPGEGAEAERGIIAGGAWDSAPDALQGAFIPVPGNTRMDVIGVRPVKDGPR